MDLLHREAQSSGRPVLRTTAPSTLGASATQALEDARRAVCRAWRSSAAPLPGAHQSAFKASVALDRRRHESRRIREKYPDRLPVIVERATGNATVPTIDKNKYLVPLELSVGQFIYVIRKRMALRPEQAIFVFINNVLPPTSSSMDQIYADHADEDGFLYVTYSGENVFGA